MRRIIRSVPALAPAIRRSVVGALRLDPIPPFVLSTCFQNGARVLR